VVCVGSSATSSLPYNGRWCFSFVTWASTLTAILAPPSMYSESCRAVSPHGDSFVVYVVKWPTTAFAVLWSCWSTPGSIIATSSLLGFLLIFNDVHSPYSTPQLVWYSDFVATTMCVTPSRYCKGCVCRNVTTLNWRSWHTECWAVWRQAIVICNHCAISNNSAQSRQWVTFHDPWPTWRIIQLTMTYSVNFIQ